MNKEHLELLAHLQILGETLTPDRFYQARVDKRMEELVNNDKAGGAVEVVPVDSALEQFSEYFEANYNGDVVFTKPRWHAEKIFRVAKRLLAASPTAPASEVLAWAILLDERFAGNWRSTEESAIKEMERLNETWPGNRRVVPVCEVRARLTASVGGEG